MRNNIKLIGVEQCNIIVALWKIKGGPSGQIWGPAKTLKGQIQM